MNTMDHNGSQKMQFLYEQLSHWEDTTVGTFQV